jgi:hypothetical protein
MERDQLIVIAIAAFILGIIIFLFLIRWAVKSANEDMVRSLRILINMKAEELKEKGIDPRKSLEPLNELDELKKLRSQERITQKQLEEMIKEKFIL